MNESQETEITFRDLTGILATSKWLIIGTTAIVTLIAVGVTWIAPRKYQASIVISAVSSDSSSGMLGGLSSLASQFGGLASLAGVSPQADSKKMESLAVLQSEQLTEMYIRENNLLPVLFQKQWDASANRWKTLEPGKEPTLWKGNVFFRKTVRTVATDTKTGLVTLSITWGDPVAAAKWANGLVELTNTYLRDKAIRESEANIAYLNEQAAKTDVLGVKQAVYSILQNEINKQMIARGSREYALKVIDPAFVPERPSSPIPVLWVGVGFGIGLLLSTVIVILREDQLGRLRRSLQLSSV